VVTVGSNALQEASLASNIHCFGEAFSDEIKLVATNVAPVGTEVALRNFAGERRDRFKRCPT
jgi:hypothetical protein